MGSGTILDSSIARIAVPGCLCLVEKNMVTKVLLTIIALNLIMLGFIAGKWTIEAKIQAMVSGPSSQEIGAKWNE